MISEVRIPVGPYVVHISRKNTTVFSTTHPLARLVYNTSKRWEVNTYNISRNDGAAIICKSYKSFGLRLWKINGKNIAYNTSISEFITQTEIDPFDMSEEEILIFNTWMEII